MNQTGQVEFIDQSIAKSPLSTDFKSVTEVLGFHTFSDLLAYRTAKLLILPGFTQHLIYEYVDYLETNDMGHLIDP